MVFFSQQEMMNLYQQDSNDFTNFTMVVKPEEVKLSVPPMEGYGDLTDSGISSKKMRT